MNPIIDAIVKKHTTCIFVSPHLDDAVFSAGGLIDYLRDKVEVKVINVFTSQGDGVNNLSAKQYLHQCGFLNAPSLFKVRKNEDQEALKSLNITPINLEYTDALWRTIEKPSKLQKFLGNYAREFLSVYPTYRFHINRGTISKHDQNLQKSLEHKLKEIVKTIKGDYLIFCPAGFGNHVDHILVRDACTKVFSNKCIYWTDSPYFIDYNQVNSFLKNKLINSFSFEITNNNKLNLCNVYKCQVNKVFKEKNILYIDELFFTDVLKDKEPKLTFTEHSSLSETLVKEWKALWEQSNHKNPFNSYEFFSNALKVYKYKSYKIFCVYDKKELVGLYPAVIDKKFFIRVFVNAGKNITDKSCFLFKDINSEVPQVLLKHLSTKGNFHISENDYSFSYKHYYRNLSLKMNPSSVGFVMKTMSNFEDILSQKTKKSLELIITRHKEQLSVKSYVGSVDQLIDTMRNIEDTSRKMRKFMTALTDSKTIELLKLLDETEKIKIVSNILYFNNEPICYQYGYLCANQIFWSQTAYSESYKSLYPGKMVMYLSLPFFKSLNITKMDLSRGDTQYKRSFTPYKYQLFSLFFSPNKLVSFYWGICEKAKQMLFSNHRIFEFLRYSKNLVTHTLDKEVQINPRIKWLGVFSSFLVVTILVLTLSIRGHYGNPNSQDLLTRFWRDDGPFELSPERGRFALTYSLAEHKSVSYSIDIARFTVPDLGFIHGKYVSLFAPGVSFIILPGYFIGKIFGISQIGSTVVISLFAIFNAILIWFIVSKLTGNKYTGIFGGLVFLFATPAFSYSISLYQHHISTFLLLIAISLVLSEINFWKLLIVWFLAALSVSVDYPNALLMLPVCIYALKGIIYINKEEKSSVLRINLVRILSFIGITLPLVFFLWFNYVSYGNPLQMAGTVPTAAAIDAEGKPAVPETAKKTATNIDKYTNPEKQHKTVSAFFYTRNLLNGFNIHLLGKERGILVYTPIVLLAIPGLYLMYKKKESLFPVIFSTIGVNLIFYSMWGDPWGGWAFGSRYMIPSYSLMAIALSYGLYHYRKYLLCSLFVFILFSYSVSVNTMGALTTSAIPPKGNAQALEQFTKRYERYSYDRSWEMLNSGVSKSLLYQEEFHYIFSAKQYFYFISALIASYGLFVLIVNVRSKDDE